jgi:subtilase family serine protease
MRVSRNFGLRGVNRGHRVAAVWLAAGVAGAAAPAMAAIPTLSSHVPAIVADHQARLIGPADPGMHMTLAVALPMRDQAGQHELLGRIYNPADPLYRHYLSVAEFADRFGPTREDYDATVKFLADSGLRVVATSANRYMVDVEGPVSAIQQAFHLTLNIYQHPTENRTFVAPDREPTLDLAVPVQHIVGLDNAVLPTTRLLAPQAGRIKPQTGTGSGPDGYFIGSDMRAAYYGSGALTGAGQSLGLMELGPYAPTDITLYFNTVKQKLNVAVNPISTDGTKPTCTKCDDAEQALDIEYAISMAPAMTQVQVYVAGSPESVLNRMASDNISKQLSTSWGWNEDFGTDDPLFIEMAMQGQSFLTASGDDSTLQNSGPWPEEDANLTAVGGTDLTTKGAAGPWQAETGWDDSAGGPSVDKTIKIESYQLPFINKKNNGSTTLRDVPDVGAAADFNFYICAQGQCVGGYAGTSFSSPIWTGFVALANQQAATNKAPEVGFLNPTLYALSGTKKTYKTILHDPIGGQSGIYKAVKGFDLVTGLGSMNSTGLITALAGGK